MRKNFLVMVCCFLVASGNLFAEEEPDCYVQGFIQQPFLKKNKAIFVLKDIKTKGFEYDNNKTDTLEAVDFNGGTHKDYTFRNIAIHTPCKSNFRVEFQYFEKNGWHTDLKETELGQFKGSETKWTLITLVIDRTSSLGDNFRKIQRNAIEFLDTIVNNANYVSGSVHINVVAFADSPEMTGIRPLTHSNAIDIKNWINNLRQTSATYLYSALDQAIDSIDAYNPRRYNAKWSDCQGISMITFTDGLDNGSMNITKKILSNRKYYTYLREKRLFVKRHGHIMTSYFIMAPGEDMYGDFQTSINEELKGLATQGLFYQVNNIDEVSARFKKIAESLTITWLDLHCIISNRSEQLVRWVFICNDPKPAPLVRYTPSFVHELGGIVGGNNGLTYKIWNTDNNFACQLDIAYNVLYRSMDLQSNFMYQNYIKDWDSGGLLWYGGGGTSFGISTESGFIWGLNGIIGLEWMFYNFPLSLSFDYRPGIGISSNFLAKGLDFSLGVRWYLER